MIPAIKQETLSLYIVDLSWLNSVLNKSVLIEASAKFPLFFLNSLGGFGHTFYKALCRQQPRYRALLAIPGFDPIVTAALLSQVGTGKQFSI